MHPRAAKRLLILLPPAILVISLFAQEIPGKRPAIMRVEPGRAI
jgi:hypothetical protein